MIDPVYDESIELRSQDKHTLILQSSQRLSQCCSFLLAYLDRGDLVVWCSLAMYRRRMDQKMPSNGFGHILLGTEELVRSRKSIRLYDEAHNIRRWITSCYMGVCCNKGQGNHTQIRRIETVSYSTDWSRPLRIYEPECDLVLMPIIKDCWSGIRGPCAYC